MRRLLKHQKKKDMKVLSLFDGMSCGQIALNRLGIEYDTYYASEIDKYAIQVAKKNYPNTIHIGDVTKVKAEDIGEIDLLLGGSPCQGFSFAGNQLNFEDPRSKLFFEYVRLLNELKPKYFLLENVKMKKESRDVISKYLGVEPIEINSALVSAQSRGRLYWTNIPNVGQPKDKGIVLKDILEDGFATDLMTNKDGKSHCLTARYNGAVWWNSIERRQRTMVLKENPTKSINGLIRIGTANLKGHDSIKRVYSEDGKSPTLTTMQGGHREPKIAIDKSSWRKLTPVECERLQTVPDNYTDGVSNTQRYKMLGNGWTIDVITHILKNIL